VVHIGRAFSSCYSNPAERQPKPLALGTSRKEIREWQVQTIVIPIPADNAACAIRYMTLVVGAPPHEEYSAAVWRLPISGGT
jgi:hypothetical protein